MQINRRLILQFAMVAVMSLVYGSVEVPLSGQEVPVIRLETFS